MNFSYGKSLTLLFTAAGTTAALIGLPGCRPPQLTSTASAPTSNSRAETAHPVEKPAGEKAGAPQAAAANALDDYIARPEAAFGWKLLSSRDGVTQLQVTSQQWQGTTWTHRVEVIRPDKLEFPDRALMIINYGNGSAQETEWSRLAANASGAWLVNLWNVPNQPLWNRTEDDLIAHTFEKYFETGDPTWPLLLPMTKSATQTMKAVEAWSKQQPATDGAPAGAVAAAAFNGAPSFRWAQDAVPVAITRWTISGASKRGWTSWLVAAADRSPARQKEKGAYQSRVEAIIPMVYDNLNLMAQMPHQVSTWGEYSAQIQDYTRRGLQAKMNTAAGRQLVEIVDPWSYRARLDLPKLIVNGTNDQYWPLDAFNLYRRGLPGGTQVFYAPNSGHPLNGNELRVAAVAAGWFRNMAAGRSIPTLDLVPRAAQTPATDGIYRFTGDTAALSLSLKTPAASNSGNASAPDAGRPRLRLWTATSTTRDFRDSKWQSEPVEADWQNGSAPITVPLTAEAPAKYFAAFVEATWNTPSLPLVLSSPVVIATRNG